MYQPPGSRESGSTPTRPADAARVEHDEHSAVTPGRHPGRSARRDPPSVPAFCQWSSPDALIGQLITILIAFHLAGNAAATMAAVLFWLSSTPPSANIKSIHIGRIRLGQPVDTVPKSATTSSPLPGDGARDGRPRVPAEPRAYRNDRRRQSTSDHHLSPLRRGDLRSDIVTTSPIGPLGLRAAGLPTHDRDDLRSAAVPGTQTPAVSSARLAVIDRHAPVLIRGRGTELIQFQGNVE